jgi:hypothetical protein
MRWSRVLLALSLGLNLWLGSAVVRLENYHYANQLGACTDNIMSVGSTQREDCLQKTETRSSWVWHLLAALATPPRFAWR